LAFGDGGGWVYNVGTGKILGQVVASGLKTCMAMVMPARGFFGDIRCAPDVNLKPQPTSGRGSRTRKYEESRTGGSPSPRVVLSPFS
jgi:hypothetical protein